MFGFYPMPLLDVINPYVDGALTHVGVSDDPPTVPSDTAADASEKGATSERVRQAGPRVRPAVAAHPRARCRLPRRRRGGVRAAAGALPGPDAAHPGGSRRGAGRHDPRRHRPRGRASTARRSWPAASSARWAPSASTARTVYLWGLILVFAILGVFLFAERRLEGGVSAFAGQAAALPGTEAERQASTRGLEHTEVYPLLLFAVGGMMLFPAANDLLTMFVALEVLSLPLYLLCGLARRRRLLSQEAALKYFLLGAFSSGFFLYGVALIYGFAGLDGVRGDQRGGPQRRGQPGPAVHGHGPALGRPAVQGRRRSLPGLDARRLPGCPDAGDGVHGRRHQGGRVRRDPAAVLRRLRLRPVVLAADAVGRRHPDDGRRRRAGAEPDRRQATARLLVGRAHRLPAHRRARAAGARRARARPGDLAAGGAVLPGDLRLRHARCLRRGDPRARLRRARRPP